MKKVSLLLVVIMIFSVLAFSVSAAVSSPEREPLETDGVYDDDGNPLNIAEIDLTALSKADTLDPERKARLLAAKKQAADAGSIEKFLENVGLKDEVIQKLGGKKPVLFDLYDISLYGDILKVLESGSGINVIFKVKDLKPDCDFVVLQNNKEVEWEIVESTVDGVKIRVRLTTASAPYMFITTQESISPKGGDNSIIPFIIIGVVAIGALTIIIIKKRKLN